MKRLKILPLVSLVISLSGCATYHPKKLNPKIAYDDVYLIMGQSNASGVAEYRFLEESNPDVYQRYIAGNSKVLMSYDCDDRVEKNFVPTQFGFGHDETFFGPEIGIAEVLNQKEESSYIIKATWSGSCLMTEYVKPNGKKLKYYKRFIPYIKEQLKSLENEGKNLRVRGVFWMQGESDSFLPYSDKYQKVEQCFYKYLRHDLNKWIYDHFNFVDAYIHTRGICWYKPEIINDCKQRFVDSYDHCYCIKTNGEDENAITLYLKSDTGEGEDLAHYDSKSMLLLGKTAGELIIK